MPVISGKVYCAKLNTPMVTKMNPDDKRYSLDVGNLDKDNVKLAKELGMNVKKDDPNSGKANAGLKESFVTLKKQGYDYNGNLNPRPAVVDAKNNPLSDDMYKKIGNGSEVNVKFSSKTTKSGFHQFHLEAVQVVSLIEYNSPESDDDGEGFGVVKGGYTAPQSEDSPFQSNLR